MDEEIQNLMEELIMRRTQERDYQSLEDQIRCLRQRFENLGNENQNAARDQSDKENDRERQIAELSQQVDEMHFQRLADQKEYAALKSEYIHLNEMLGHREAELADQRQKCTQQLGYNKELEQQGEQLQSENARLRSHIRDCQNEQQRTRQFAENLSHEASDKQSIIQRIDANIQSVEDEIRDKERQAAQLNHDITERKSALL